MSDNLSRQNFKEKLDDQYSWPALYMFKFIVNKGKESEVVALFPFNEVTTKLSKNGNYISVTAKVMMGSSDEIIRIYEEAYKIEGVISL
jgi:uncharacterized protein